MAGRLALLNRVRAKARADRPLLDDRKRCRQRAGAQQQAQPVNLFHREIAGDLTSAAWDFANDSRRGHDLVVENDGEGLADVIPCNARECHGAPGVEFEIDRAAANPATAVVVPSVGIHDIVAADQHFPANEDVAPSMLGVRQQLIVWRHTVGLGFFRGYRRVDKLERQFGGRADSRFDFRRRKPRHLDQQAVLALGLDRGFRRSLGIDAAADNFDRARNRALHPMLQAWQSRLDGNHAVFAGIDGQVEPATAAPRNKRGRNRLRELFEAGQRIFHLGRVFHVHADLVSGNQNAAMTDILLAQGAPCIGLQRLQPIFPELGRVDLIKQVRAASEVEAERHARKLRPGRQTLVSRERNQVRHGEEHRRYRQKERHRRAPARKM